MVKKTAVTGNCRGLDMPRGGDCLLVKERNHKPGRQYYYGGYIHKVLVKFCVKRDKLEELVPEGTTQGLHYKRPLPLSLWYSLSLILSLALLGMRGDLIVLGRER